MNRIDWAQFAGTRALRCLPAIVAPLIYGIVFDKPVQSLLAAAGAMSVGFGSFHKIYRSRAAPMVLASFAMALSAFVGTQVRHWDYGIVIIAGIWGFACGLSSPVGQGATYIATQAIVFLLLSTAFPTTLSASIPLVLLVLGAGLLQTLTVTLFRVFGSKPRSMVSQKRRIEVGPLRGARLAFHTFRRTATRPSTVLRHAVRMGLTMIVAVALLPVFKDRHSYWMPMTTAIILQQDWHQTITKALARVGGTLLGVGLATLIVAECRPEHFTLILLVAIFAWLAYSTLRINYVIFAACITAYIVFLLSFAGLPELSVVKTRVTFTAFGACIALIAASFPTAIPVLQIMNRRTKRKR